MFGYDWPRLHAALNDLPAALLVFAVLFDLASAAFKRESLRWAATWTLWAGVVGGWAAYLSGTQAEDAIQHGTAIHDLMQVHEKLALWTMVLFTAILVWKLWRRFAVSGVEELVLRLLGVAGLALVVRTGQIGGKLMFDHAAGIPNATLQAELENRAAGHAHAEGEEHEHDPADTAAHSHADSAAAPTGHVDPPGTPPHEHQQP